MTGTRPRTSLMPSSCFCATISCLLCFFLFHFALRTLSPCIQRPLYFYRHLAAVVAIYSGPLSHARAYVRGMRMYVCRHLDFLTLRSIFTEHLLYTSTMAPPVKKKKALAAKKKSSPIKKQELQKKNLNISAGGNFYERASSRRSRHRDALMNQESFPLKRSSSLTEKNKKRRVFTDVEEEEERMEQKGKLRFSKLAWASGRRPSIDGAKSRPETCVRGSLVSPTKEKTLSKKKTKAALHMKPLPRKRARTA